MTRRLKRPGTQAGTANLTNTTDHSNLPSYTVATLPSPSTAIQGRLVYVSDGTTNQRLAICDGAAWRFPSGSVVS